MSRATSSTRSVMITKSLVPRISWACCATCTLTVPSSPKLELLGREHTNGTLWPQRTGDPKLRPPQKLSFWTFCTANGEVTGIIRVKLSAALRIHSRCTWRHREGSRNVHNTAIRRALSPSRPCGSVTAGVHGCPRGVAPIRHHTASRDIPGPHTGGATTHALHHAS